VKKVSAFTLIELLIVVAIIAILAAIAVPNFLEAQTRAKASRAKSDLRTIITGLESYAVDNNKYPVPRYASPTGPGGAAPSAAAGSCAQFVCGGYHEFNSASEIVGGLSSPIAYLSTGSLKDPFATGSYDELRNDLGYQNIVLWTTSPGIPFAETGQATLIGNGIIEDYGQYVVRSVGPDKVYTPVNNPYDPTNGTVSRGDIYRTQKRAKNSRSVGGE
jgi:prepilin-type N-terminal cleavage/methylation domain-containing protein